MGANLQHDVSFILDLNDIFRKGSNAIVYAGPGGYKSYSYRQANKSVLYFGMPRSHYIHRSILGFRRKATFISETIGRGIKTLAMNDINDQAYHYDSRF
jgi:hypothetical protein